MTTTDPKLIERAMDVWLDAVDAYQDNPPTKFDHGIPNKSAAAVIAAAINEAAQNERAGNYKSFTDGMEAAAQICGSLAETTYDDADAFEAAIGCEAAIMRVVMAQRREQAAIEAHEESQP